MNKLLAFALIAFATVVPAAQPRVHSVPIFQDLEWPLGGDHPNFLAEAVGIDGDSIIVIVDNGGDGADIPTNRVALLYRRGANQRWAFSRILTQITAPRDDLRAAVAMKNNIAVVKIHRDAATVWEKAGGNWIQATVTNGLHEPGDFAISGSRILAGSSGCENDGLIYEKSTAGSWVIAGKIAPDAGVCADEPRSVELNYDFAFIRSSPTLFRSYKKEGGALQWAPNRTITLPSSSSSPIAVQLGVAVAPGNAYFTRGATWNYAGQLTPIDYAMGPGDGGKVVYRDGVVLINDGWDTPRSAHSPYVYIPNSSGGFDHVGILQAAGDVSGDFDISGKTIVAGSATDFGFIDGSVSVYVLPSTLLPPAAVANNFDAHDVSGLNATPGTFALAGNSSNYVLRQPWFDRDAVATFSNTDWRDYQSIATDVTTSGYGAPEAWAGVAVRYVDDSNYYFAAMNGAHTFQIGRKVNGVTTILAEEDMDLRPRVTYHISLTSAAGELGASLSGGGNSLDLHANDASLVHGRAALVTHLVRADYDNVYVKPTSSTSLFSQEYPLWVFGRPLKYVGGNWQEVDAGLQQSDTSGNAFAIIPNPAIDNQTINADAVLNSFGSTNPVAWFGLVARYIDPQNYYYLSIRSSNSLQIRKVVNGVVTVLKGVTLTITSGSTHRYSFDVRGNELSASVDGIVLARAIDNSLARGQYGFATYRADATYTVVSAFQP